MTPAVNRFPHCCITVQTAPVNIGAVLLLPFLIEKPAVGMGNAPPCKRLWARTVRAAVFKTRCAGRPRPSVMIQSVPACPRSGRARPEQADAHHGHVVAAAGGGPFPGRAQQFLAQPVRRVRQPFFQRVLQRAFAGFHRAV